MEKRIGKSVVATGIAATTIISGGLSHQVKAEEIAKSTTVEPKSTAVTEKPITTADVAEAKEQADAAKANADQQQEQADKAQADVEAAKNAVTEAEKSVETATENEKEATDEEISQAEEHVKSTEEAAAAKAAAVENAETAVADASQAVKDQENKIAAQQSLVDVAESELNKAKEPVHAEEEAVETAKNQQNQAQNALEHAKNELKKAEQDVKDSPQAQSDIQSKINKTQAELNQTEQLITSTNTELAIEQKNAATAPVDLRNTNYSQFLENLRNNAPSQAVRDAATNALAMYQRGQREYGITVGTDPTSPASLENNLQALELVKAINAYRRNAGLPELLVDPYANVASQIQTVYFEKANWHMGKLIGNENVAISFTPQGAVNFWHSEKALYQKIAAQYGLPTDETQIDANAIYMRVGASVFAQIGHYVQMMDNKANAISAAYDTHPNQWGTPYGTSEVGFHNIRNFNERVNNGTLMSADALAQLLRSGGGRSVGSSANVTALKNRLAGLQAQKVSQESTINILNSQLADVRNSEAARATALANARKQVDEAETNLAVTKQNVADKKAALAAATTRISNALAPYQAKLAKAQTVLGEAQTQLVALKAAEQKLQSGLGKIKEELAAAQERVLAAQQRVVSLKEAPQQLAKAKQNLVAAKADFEAKKSIAEEENMKLLGLQSIYTDLQAKHSRLQSNLLKEEGNRNASQLSYRGAAAGGKDTSIEYRSNAGAPSTNGLPTASSDEGNNLVTTGTNAQGGKATSQVTPSASGTGTSTTTLPNTGSGSEAERLAVLGMAIGAATLVGANKRRRRNSN